MTDKPGKDDGLVIDANCLIYAAMFTDRSNLNHYLSKPIRCFIDETLFECPVGYYSTIEKESWAHIADAVDGLAERKGVKDVYKIYKFMRKSESNLNDIFDKLDLLEEKHTVEEISEARTAFKDYINTVQLSGGYTGKGIPEDTDLGIILSTSKESWKKQFILSNDGHFTNLSHSEHIKSKYGVSVIDASQLRQEMQQYRWN